MHTFQQEPRPVPGTTVTAARTKYRDPWAQPPPPMPSNIMWDRRVVRGNTYAAQILPLAQAEAEAEAQRAEEKERRRRMLAEQRRRERQENERKAMTPEPVDGRKHFSVQTEKFLEEIVDKIIEVDADTQTDPLKDRPPSPLFIPVKSGIDKETQIEDNDLFDFDFEVEPILEVLIGKTLEQSMMEVMEEEEIKTLKTHQADYERIHNAELAETQRLEAEERRKFEERERRMAQERARLEKERQAKEKLSSIKLSKEFLATLEDRVFAQLEEMGYFYDRVEREVQTDFIPWLLEQVNANLEKKKRSRAAVEELIRAALRAGN